MGYRRTTKKAIAMAQKAGYDTAAYIGEYGGNSVYEPRFNDNEMRYLGFPQFILAHGSNLRWTTDEDESAMVMRTLMRHKKYR